MKNIFLYLLLWSCLLISFSMSIAVRIDRPARTEMESDCSEVFHVIILQLKERYSKFDTVFESLFAPIENDLHDLCSVTLLGIIDRYEDLGTQVEMTTLFKPIYHFLDDLMRLSEQLAFWVEQTDSKLEEWVKSGGEGIKHDISLHKLQREYCTMVLLEKKRSGISLNEFDQTTLRYTFKTLSLAIAIYSVATENLSSNSLLLYQMHDSIKEYHRFATMAIPAYKDNVRKSLLPVHLSLNDMARNYKNKLISAANSHYIEAYRKGLYQFLIFVLEFAFELTDLAIQWTELFQIEGVSDNINQISSLNFSPILWAALDLTSDMVSNNNMNDPFEVFVVASVMGGLQTATYNSRWKAYDEIGAEIRDFKSDKPSITPSMLYRYYVRLHDHIDYDHMVSGILRKLTEIGCGDGKLLAKPFRNGQNDQFCRGFLDILSFLSHSDGVFVKERQSFDDNKIMIDIFQEETGRFVEKCSSINLMKIEEDGFEQHLNPSFERLHKEFIPIVLRRLANYSSSFREYWARLMDYLIRQKMAICLWETFFEYYAQTVDAQYRPLFEKMLDKRVVEHIEIIRAGFVALAKHTNEKSGIYKFFSKE